MTWGVGEVRSPHRKCRGMVGWGYRSVSRHSYPPEPRYICVFCFCFSFIFGSRGGGNKGALYDGDAGLGRDTVM